VNGEQRSHSILLPKFCPRRIDGNQLRSVGALPVSESLNSSLRADGHFFLRWITTNGETGLLNWKIADDGKQ
jgi:hypothetical protein